MSELTEKVSGQLLPLICYNLSLMLSAHVVMIHSDRSRRNCIGLMQTILKVGKYRGMDFLIQRICNQSCHACVIFAYEGCFKVCLFCFLAG